MFYPDSFRKGFHLIRILLFHKMRGWLSSAPQDQEPRKARTYDGAWNSNCGSRCNATGAPSRAQQVGREEISATICHEIIEESGLGFEGS
jgi:hypothetical protein